MCARQLGSSLWLGIALAACGPSAPSAPPSDVPAERAAPEVRAAARAQVGGDVVATVDGEPITVADVAWVAREAGIPPRAALVRLEEELALAHLAEPAVTAGDPEVGAAVRRAAVRELLSREIEAHHLPEEVPDALIEARRAEMASALAQPETRRATHLLVPLEAGAEQAQIDAAYRLARAVRIEAAQSPDPAGALTAHAGPSGAFELVVEHLDALPRAQLDGPFGDALFAATEPGLLPDVVRSSYGVHVVVLQEIVPPWEVPREEWLPALRRQIAAEQRAEAMEALAAALAEQTPVLLSEEAMRFAESMPIGEEEASGGGSL